MSAAEIRRAIDLFVDPSGLLEIRAPKPINGAAVWVKRFEPTQLSAAVGAVVAADEAAKYQAIYCTLNPVKPIAGKAAKDKDVVHRRRLLVDCDPVRPADTSATDDEHQSALERVVAIRDWLTEQGWPLPVVADSSNGGHLIYAIDLPNDKAADDLVHRCLKALKARFSDDAVGVDTTVKNASRITKIYGTVSRKGDNTPERPHRRSRLIEVPERLLVAPVDLLRELAGLETPEQGAIRRSVQIVRNAVDGEKHGALNKAAYLLGGYVASGVVDENAARAALRDAIASKANVADIDAAYRTIDDGLTAGQSAPTTGKGPEKSRAESAPNTAKSGDLNDDEPPDWPDSADEPEGGTRGTAGGFTKHHPMLMRKSGTSELLKNHFNAVAVAENALPGLIGYNEFRQRIEKRINPPWGGGPGQWTERDTSELACYVAKPFAHFGLDLLGGAIMGVAHRHPFNPGQDRLRALAEQWDGVPRIDSWLVDYLNAKVNSSNSDYLREMGACWIKGVAARVLKPGCKRDDVFVLRGDQGWRKSTAARIIADAIAPDAFTDCLGDLGSKDARGGIRGVVIAELGELASLNKSDVESVKAFVAAPSDRFREAYGRGERDYPRTVSFIGTTNHPTFLQDPTGNRRWWPVSMSGPIDTDLLTDAMPQILGEAARRVLKGEAWHVTHTAALAQAEGVRAAHFEDDVWTAPALAAVDRLGGDYVTVGEILSAMNIRLEQQTMTAQKRIGGILRTNGYQDKRKKINGRLVWVWTRVGIPLEVGGYHRGIPPEASQTAVVPPYPPISPFQHNLVKIVVEEAGDTANATTSTPETATVAPAISTLCRKEGDKGDTGGYRKANTGSNQYPPAVSPSEQGDTAPPLSPVEPDFSGLHVEKFD